jgi:DNA helicase-2/ATP-dependent DNA helicase PcrA
MAENVAEVYDLYQKRLYENNAMDFDDLIMQTVALLEVFPEVRERYAARRELFVERAERDNGAASPDTIAARWRAPPDPPVVGSSKERTGHA